MKFLSSNMGYGVGEIGRSAKESPFELGLDVLRLRCFEEWRSKPIAFDNQLLS